MHNAYRDREQAPRLGTARVIHTDYCSNQQIYYPQHPTPTGLAYAWGRQRFLPFWRPHQMPAEGEKGGVREHEMTGIRGMVERLSSHPRWISAGKTRSKI
jgi:hypothetical protein